MRIIDRQTNHFDQGGGAKTFTNRAGTTTIVGGVYLLDTVQADGDSGSIEAGLDNLVLAATATLANPRQIVVAQEAAADNAKCKCVQPSPAGTVMQVLVETTTDIAKGDRLKLVNGQAYLVKATTGAPAGTDLADRFVGEALEARTANDTGLIWAIMYPLNLF